jgi:NADPH:quinone reductase-like Zn-dependent oxidoreductase
MHSNGSPDVIEVREVPKPQPEAGEVLVRGARHDGMSN